MVTGQRTRQAPCLPVDVSQRAPCDVPIVYTTEGGRA
jgi:hypothetical protein